MTASDAGAVGPGACAPFNSVVLAGKDCSLSYGSRTDPAAGGAARAQPNAVDLMGELKTNASYIKTRGYALQLRAPINAWSAVPRPQAEECLAGLNCFNATALRLRLAALLRGAATPNEVLLTSPACAGGGPALAPDVCGPWPGLPPFADQVQCVCAPPPPGGAAGAVGACFWTARAAYVSRWLGLRLGPPLNQAPTAADCAAYTLAQLAAAGAPLAWAAFVYAPSVRSCFPRRVDPAYAGRDLCTSDSALCRKAAVVAAAAVAAGAADADAIVAEVAAIVSPGAQMYWRAGPGGPACAVRAEVAQQCSTGRPAWEYSPHRVFTDASTGLPGGLDAFHVIVNLHSETAADVAAAAALQSPPSEPAAAAALRGLLAQYSITQIAVANDKRPLLGGGAVGRERDLQAAGYINASAGLLTACGKCDGPCECARAGDGDDATCVPLGAGGFWETSIAPGPAFAGPVHAVVSRVDVGLCAPSPDDPRLCDAAAGVEAEPRAIQLNFSDGTTRMLDVTVGDVARAFYFPPSVAFWVRATLVDGPTAGLFRFAVVGQPFSETFNASAARVDLFSAAGAAAARSAGLTATYSCPPTTFASPGQGMCVPCPYPAVSPAGSTGAANCTCPVCGDGRLHWQADEKCDDGNVVGGDGCSSSCKIEPLQFCVGPRDARSGVGLPLLSYGVRDQCLRLGSYWIPYGAAPWTARFGAAALVHQVGTWKRGGCRCGRHTVRHLLCLLFFTTMYRIFPLSMAFFLRFRLKGPLDSS